LVEFAGCKAVEGVEEAGYRIEDAARAWVEWHVVEGEDGEEDAEVACWDLSACYARYAGDTYLSSLE